jgi:hypothetical protein
MSTAHPLYGSKLCLDEPQLVIAGSDRALLATANRVGFSTASI